MRNLSYYFVVLCFVWADVYSAPQTIESEGIAIDFNWQSIDDKQVEYHFHIRDTTNGSPVLGAYPAAWVHPAGIGRNPQDKSKGECRKQAQTFIGGSLFSRADIDLNQYYVVTMNDDASLSVVDPLFGFGGSKLLNRITLPSTAYDWALSAKGQFLWMSFPESKSIGRLNTSDWKLQVIPVSKTPGQLLLQQDEHYLWVALEDTIAAVTTHDLKVLKEIPLPAKATDLLSSTNSQWLYASMPDHDHVAIIDIAELALKKIKKTGSDPISLAYSDLSQLLYVANKGGTVDVLQANDLTSIATMTSQPGLTQLRFEPKGRWGFMVNSETDRLSIIDAAKNTIVQKGLVESQPISIDFSNDLAYIRHRNSSTLLMISLDDQEIGRPGAAIPVVDTPGGDYPPGLEASTVASGIIKAPGANAVLIANPKDQAVYFYKEGMAAPMGQFGNYGQNPRAVLALDRSLRDNDGQGSYKTIAEMPQDKGVHDVVFFMDSPRRVHCFRMDLGVNSSSKMISQKSSVHNQLFRALSDDKGYRAKHSMDLRFHNHTDQVIQKVDVIISANSGLWRQRKQWLVDQKGILQVSFTPPMAGLYHLQYRIGSVGRFKELGSKWYEVNE